jgi:hypothetical protein
MPLGYGISAVVFFRPHQLETCCQEFPTPFLDVSHQRFSASGNPDTIHTRLKKANQTISAENLDGSDLLEYLRVRGRIAKRIFNKD